MKFKVLVVVFNIVILTIFFSILLFPIMGIGFIDDFWNKYWMFIPIFLIILVFTNVIYFKNRKTIESIESEDWTALCLHLEEEVFQKKHLSFRNVRLLAETMLLLSDFRGLTKLETFIRSNKPEFLVKLASRFAGGKMLCGKYEELYEFTSNISKRKDNTDEWIVFYSGFALQMMKEYKLASNRFAEIYDSLTNDLIKVLTAYMLFDVLKDKGQISTAKSEINEIKIKQEIKKKFSINEWRKYISKQKEDIHVLLFKKVIEDATLWLYKA